MTPEIGGFYRVGNKTVQVWYECQALGYYGCGVLEDTGDPPFNSRRGQTLTLQHTEVFSDFAQAIKLQLTPVEDQTMNDDRNDQDTRGLKELAREALQVQNASNLSGLVHGWSRSITRLRELLPGSGTYDINTHSINQLWASKVHELSGMGLSDAESYHLAYHRCEELANG